jgi:hypothetical protein
MGNLAQRIIQLEGVLSSYLTYNWVDNRANHIDPKLESLLKLQSELDESFLTLKNLIGKNSTSVPDLAQKVLNQGRPLIYVHRQFIGNDPKTGKPMYLGYAYSPTGEM